MHHLCQPGIDEADVVGSARTLFVTAVVVSAALSFFVLGMSFKVIVDAAILDIASGAI